MGIKEKVEWVEKWGHFRQDKNKCPKNATECWEGDKEVRQGGKGMEVNCIFPWTAVQVGSTRRVLFQE